VRRTFVKEVHAIVDKTKGGKFRYIGINETLYEPLWEVFSKRELIGFMI